MTLLKQFRNALKNEDLPEAWQIAMQIEREGYPESLKHEARKFLQEANWRPIPQSNTYCDNLYLAITCHQNSSQLESPPPWLPWQIIRDTANCLTYIRNPKDAAEAHFKTYLAEGKHILHYLKEIKTETIEAAIGDLFDHSYYLDRHPDLHGISRREAIHHYAFAGGTEQDREPNPLFRNKDLFDCYPWTKQLGVNALYLFARWPEQFNELVEIVRKRHSLYNSHLHFPWERLSFVSEISTEKLSGTDYHRVLAVTKESSSKNRRITPDFDGLNIHIVIPDFTKGGGGHMTIFRMILHLEKAGHKCTVWVKDFDYKRHPEGPRITAINYYQPIKAHVLPLTAHFAFSRGDALIATSWDTVEIVTANKSFHDHFYLVQDYEPYFYPRGSDALEAEWTYMAALKTICASSWLDEIMRKKFGKVSEYFDLSYNPLVYGQDMSRTGQVSYDQRPVVINEKEYQRLPIVRIAFYSRSRTERRAVSLALRGLEVLNQDSFTICVELFGEEKGKVKLPANVVGYDNGILEPKQLSELYRACDIGLTFSATNYALVPQEMMACGLPVIEIANDSTRAIYPQDILVLAEPSARGIAKAIEELARDKAKRLKISQLAKEWVSRTSWEGSFERVENFIRKEVTKSAAEHMPSASVIEHYLNQPHKPILQSKIENYCASIVIPTYQGGGLLHEVLANINSQVTQEPFEIIIIDSDSSDGSVESLPVCSNMAIYKVTQKDFQHGRTRNLGIALANAPLVAFLTQDAIPANNNWLSNLIRPLQENNEVQAVFGSHRAHPSHPKYLDQQLVTHFAAFDKKKIYRNSDNLKAYYSVNPGHRQSMHFYSDNNSCLRKSAWAKYPYPDVSYGEDQLYADWIIQSGQAKAFAADAVVFHSHHYDKQEEFSRARTEALFFRKYFGYDLSQDRVSLEVGIELEAQKVLSSSDPDIRPFKAHILELIREKHEGYRAGSADFLEWLMMMRRE
jgi:glycosyltransferase involved in cell wall biosynthesis